LNIYDIAEAAGVSIATVSRVLGDSDKVSPQTRERVQKVIAQKGFIPNPFARGLGLGSLELIGLLCTDVSDIFYATAVSNLEKQLRQYGLGTLLCCTGSALPDIKEGVGLLLGKKVDAIILIGSALAIGEDQSHFLEAAKHCPLFGINLYMNTPGFYGVVAEQKEAMYDSVKRLQEAGCRKIAYFYDGDTPSNREKLDGYREALLEPDEALVVRVEQKDPDVAREAAQSLFESHQADAILASEDVLAVGAYQAMAATGRRVPTIGFNNSILARCATPSLTSVDNMLDSLCTLVVGQLVDVLGGKEVPRKISLACRLVERDTFQIGGN